MEVHFNPADRKIFSFHNGEKVVAADPLALRGGLVLESLARGTTIDKLIDGANSVDLDSATEMQLAEGWKCAFVLSEVATKVFELVPFDRETRRGADMAHALGVLNAFTVWLQKKSPPGDSPPTSTLPTASISEIPTTMGT